MNEFDLAASIDQTTLNSQIGALFGLPQLQSVLWSGNVEKPIQGGTITGSWAIKASPTISLAEPTSDQWSQAVDADGMSPTPVTPAGTISFPSFYADLTYAGSTLNDTFPVSAIFQAAIINNSLSLAALGIIVDMSSLSADDQIIVRYVVIPTVIQQVNSMVGRIALPQLALEGVEFGTPILGQFSDRLIVVAALASNPAPTVPAESDLPAEPLFVLASPAALQAAATQKQSLLSTHPFSDSGTSPGDWSASLTLTDPTILVNTSDPTSVSVTFTPTIQTSVTMEAGPCAIGTAISS